MKRFPKIFYVLLMAFVVLSLGGCGSDDDDEGGPATDRLMVLTSPILRRDGAYLIYRGDSVSMLGTEAQYYVAPLDGGDDITMNLQFLEPISPDVAFVVTTAGEDPVVVFGYNPRGTISFDTTTQYGGVMRFGGSQQQLRYTGTEVAGASLSDEQRARSSAIELDMSDEIVINLDGDTASIEGEGAIPFYNYVWHADPNHKDEYYTLGDDDEELEEYSAGESIYIARDIRYLSDTLEFTGTATKDGETEYVAYYDDSVAEELAEELGEDFAGPYIFATLPAEMGQGGPGGGNPPDDGPGGDNPPDRPGGEDPTETRSAVSNSDISAFSKMTHSAEEAYNNPVLHITEPGTYRLKGNWHGQVWLDPGEDNDIAIILDGVTLSCDVAPAIVFHDVRECGPDDENTAASDYMTLGTNLLGEDETAHAGAMVLITDGSTNTVSGTNVYRMLKAEPKSSAAKVNGTDISDQKKRYKMDAAFYSFVSLAIGEENDNGGGTLSIKSDYEGLDSELHMLIDSGTITVEAEDDAINVNEDDISVFTMNGGTLNISSANGDGIDSNGYVVVNGGTLNISAGSQRSNSAGEAGIDAEKETYVSANATYNWSAAGTSIPGDTDQPGTTEPSDDEENNTTQTKKTIEITNSDGAAVLSLNYDTPVIDEETTYRNISADSEIFILRHKVNNFSGITRR